MKTHTNRFAISALLMATGLVLGGCAAIPVASSGIFPPAAPKLTAVQAKDLVSRKPVPSTEGTLPDFSQVSLGINEFDGDIKGGPLLTNTLWRTLIPAQQAGKIKIVDRSKITEVVRELSQTNSDWTNLSENEKAKRIGKLIQADYLVFCSLSEYRSDEKQLDITPQLSEAERNRYLQDFNDYSTRVDKAIKDLQVKAIVLPQASMEINKLETQRNQAMPDNAFRNAQVASRLTTETVASVGITVRMIEVATGQVRWVFDASGRDTGLDTAGQILVTELAKSVFARTPTMN